MFNWKGGCAGRPIEIPAKRVYASGHRPMSQVATETEAGSKLGRAFAEALSRKQFDSAIGLLGPEIEFRALTPRRSWEASTPSAVADVLRQWFRDTVEIEEIVAIETDSVADRQRVSYRFEGHNEDGPFVIEQQAYYSERDGRIVWMRVLCSGYRPRV
jgi:hypothetical protein